MYSLDMIDKNVVNGLNKVSYGKTNHAYDPKNPENTLRKDIVGIALTSKADGKNFSQDQKDAKTKRKTTTLENDEAKRLKELVNEKGKKLYL